MRKSLEYFKESLLSALIFLLHKYVSNAKEGLPDRLFFFVSSITPLINVDLLVQRSSKGKKQTLLSWRDDFFYKGWHIPGGIVRFKETFAERIEKVAGVELGSRISRIGKLVAINEKVSYERDIRGHFVSLLFQVDLHQPPNYLEWGHGEDSLSSGELRWHENPPSNLIRQHRVYIQYF